MSKAFRSNLRRYIGASVFGWELKEGDLIMTEDEFVRTCLPGQMFSSTGYLVEAFTPLDLYYSNYKTNSHCADWSHRCQNNRPIFHDVRYVIIKKA